MLFLTLPPQQPLFIIVVPAHYHYSDASCADGDLSLDSKCYRKFDRQLSWYSASNDCLSRGGSLAVFAETGHPSLNSHLTEWLGDSGTYNSYWIGIVRSWWKTTDEGSLHTFFSAAVY